MMIVKASKKDAQQICENNINMAKETENIQLSKPQALQAVLNLIHDDSKGFYLLAKENNKIFGQLMITFEWSDWRNSTIWWIQSVYIITSCRKQGIFQNLYDFVKKMAKQQGVTLLRLYVHQQNTHAQSVYKTVGMKKTAYHIFETELI